VVAEPDGEGSF